MRRALCAAVAGCLASASPAAMPVATLFDLVLGTAAADIPSTGFIDFACGSNGGPPGAPIAGFAAFATCPPDAQGLHEVVFAYDDTAEYVARAHDDPSAAWGLGTAIAFYPIIPSALFDAQGRLVGLRIVTDPRPEQGDGFLRLRPRAEHYLLGDVLAAQLELHAADCGDRAPTATEAPVLGMLVERDCDAILGKRHVTIAARLYRRPGETDIDPHTGLPTSGDYLSETRAEIRLIAGEK